MAENLKFAPKNPEKDQEVIEALISEKSNEELRKLGINVSRYFRGEELAAESAKPEPFQKQTANKEGAFVHNQRQTNLDQEMEDLVAEGGLDSRYSEYDPVIELSLFKEVDQCLDDLAQETKQTRESITSLSKKFIFPFTKAAKNKEALLSRLKQLEEIMEEIEGVVNFRNQIISQIGNQIEEKKYWLIEHINHFVNNIIIEMYRAFKAEMPSEKRFHAKNVAALKRQLSAILKDWRTKEQPKDQQEN
jgi:hypothetical protein